MALSVNRTPEDILQEELLRERAAVLGRAGESVARALEKLRGIEMKLEEHLQQFREVEQRIAQGSQEASFWEKRRGQMVAEINREISRYNGAREYALKRHHYLIVTREAMGMRRHHWVDKHYCVPPRKKHLQDA